MSIWFRKLLLLLLLGLLQVQLASGVVLPCRHAEQPAGVAHTTHCPDGHLPDRSVQAEPDGGPVDDCPKCDLSHLWSGGGILLPLQLGISVHRSVTQEPAGYLDRYRFDPDLVHRPPITA